MRKVWILGSICGLLLMVAACGGGDEADGPVGVSADGEIDVAALARFVEEARGREFSSEPKVTFVDEIGGGPGGGGIAKSEWDLFRLTGLIPEDSDRSSANAVFSQGISGVCCPVRVVSLDDPVATASVVVHELVHLLDRDIGTPTQARPSLLEAAHVLAVVEGNAARVQEVFLTRHGRDVTSVQDQIEIPPEMPTGIVNLIVGSYSEGAVLTSQIAAEGGERAIDDAYGRHPASAEQVMFPAAYISNDSPARIEAPNLVEGESPLQEGTLGTFVLRVMVPDDRVDVLSQWSGDAYSLWELDDEVCMTAEILMDSAEAASLLGTAITESNPDMTVVALGERVALERCLPAM